MLTFKWSNYGVLYMLSEGSIITITVENIMTAFMGE